MSESPKRMNRVAASFSDRELLDLTLLANSDNRSVSEMLYVLARRYMYGRVGANARQVTQSRCDTLQQRGEFSDTSFDPASL